MLELSCAVTNDKKQPFTEDDIHDYVDGRMDADRRRLFDIYLSENPDIARVVSDYRRQNELLRALFGDGRSRTQGGGNGRGRLN